MKTETREMLIRLGINGGIVMLAASLTALFQFLATVDFGQFTPYVTALTSLGIKGVQVWSEGHAIKR